MFRLWWPRRSEKSPRAHALIEELEPRILLSADPIPEASGLVSCAEVWTLEVTAQDDTQLGVHDRDLEYRSVSAQTSPAGSGTAGDVPAVVHGEARAATSGPAPNTAIAGLTPALAFEKNAGQTADFVDFLARGDGYTVFLENGNALIDLRSDDGSGHVVELSVTGARSEITGIGESMLAGKSNYLVGGAQSHATGIDNFAAVRYAGIYDGIDLRYYGNARALEYDFIVDAGADAGTIALRFDGATAIGIGDNGDLVITLDDAGRSIRFHAPVSYQESAGGGRDAIDSHYVMRADGSIGFQVGDYDRTRALIIDPTLSWSTYLGGTGLEEIEGVAVDGSGNVYVAGSTGSATLPVTLGAYDTTIGGSRDAFVVKYNANGVVQYATYLGGSNNEWAYELDVDSAGQVYVVGETNSTDLPLLNQAYSDINGALSDGYLIKLNAAGDAILYSTVFGESFDNYTTAVSVDVAGLAHVVGNVRPSAGGSWNVYTERIDTTASGLGSELWWRYLGTAGDDTAYDLSLDSAGNIYVVGETYSNGLATGSPFGSSFNGAGDGFIARYNAAGTLTYFSYVGGTGNDGLNGIVIDANDNLYVTGWTASATGIATAGAYDTTAPSVQDAFLARFDTSLVGSAQQVFGTYFGGSGVSRAAEIALDGDGNPVIVGDTSGSLAVTAGALQSTSGGGNEAFIAKFNTTGTSLLYGSYLGGSNTDTLTDVAIGANGYLYVAGVTYSSGLSTAGAADTTSDTTSGEGILARMSLAQAPVATVPGAQTTSVNTPLVFSSGGGNGISIADADAGSAVTEVRLTVTNGTLSLSGTAGLSFLVGDGSGDATMTFSGTLTDINAALDGLSYAPTASYTGGAVLTVVAGDHVLSDLNIDVDLQARYTFENNADNVGPLGAPTGSLVNGANYVTDGTRGTVLDLDGIDDHVTIASTFSNPADVTIGGWVHLDAASGRSEFISLDDRVHIALDETGIGVKGSIQSGVGVWNDLASGQYIAGTGWHHVMYTFSDSGNVHRLYIDGLEVASEATTDSIYWTGATTTYIGRHPANLHHLDGQVDDVRIYDRVLTATEVMALASDLAYSATSNVALTVNAANVAPVAVADTGTAVEAGGVANATAGTNPTGNVLANDTDADAGDTQTVTGVTAGVAGSASGNVGSAVAGSYGSITIAADGSYTYTVNNANTTVQALADATQTLTDTFTYTMRDAGGLTSTAQITVTVQGANDAPVVANLAGDTLAYVAGDPATVIEQGFDLAVSDVDSPNFDTGTLTVSITAGGAATEDQLGIRHQGNAGGQIGVSGATVSYQGTAIGTFSGGSGGTPLVVTLNSNVAGSARDALLLSITYVNTNNVAPTLGTRTVSFVLTDGDGGTSATYAAGVTLSMPPSTPVNSVPGAQSVAEDTPFSFTGGNTLSVADADGDLATVQLSVPAGTLTVTLQFGVSISVGSNGSSSMTLSGGQAALNATLATLTYQGAADATGADDLTIVSTDGLGASDTDVVAINLTAVNDEQVLATNTGAAVAEAGTVSLTNIMLSATDVDNSALQRVYTVSTVTANGELRLSGTALGAGDSFTQDDIDNGRVTYVHDGSETVGDAFAFALDDGAGAVTTGTFSITVTAVNDAPAVAINGGLSVNAGTTGAVIGAALLSEGDPDDTGAGVTYTLTTATARGTLRLGGVTLAAGGVFTQADIDAGLLTYDHDGSTSGADAFVYSMADGGEDGALPVTATFVITIVQPVVIPPTLVTPPDAGPDDPLQTPPDGGASDAGEPAVTDPAVDTQDAESTASHERLDAILAALMPARERTPEGEPSLASSLDRMSPLLSAAGGARPANHLLLQHMMRERFEAAASLDFQWIYGAQPRLTSWQVTAGDGSVELSFEPLERAAERPDTNVVAIMNPALWGGLMAGFGTAWWAGRAGILLGSVVAGTPAWAQLDPLPIASNTGAGGRDSEDDEPEQARPGTTERRPAATPGPAPRPAFQIVEDEAPLRV